MTIILLIVVCFSGGSLAAAESDKKSSVTAKEEVLIDTLRVQLRPLGVKQLEAELEAWMNMLKTKIAEGGKIEIQIAESEPSDEEAEKKEESEQEVEKKETEIEALRKKVIALRTEEAAIIERTKVVMVALTAKGGDASEAEAYIAAVSDLSASGDSESRLATLIAAGKNWLTSPEGGVDLFKRAIVALIIFVTFWFISRFAGKLIGRSLTKRNSVSSFLTNFAKKATRGLVLFVGVLMTISALGVSVGPLMAALGAGGFIVGFALQETLSNFASGLMIMIYRPFDVKDFVSVAGSEGNVKELSLVATTLVSLDNKVLVIPNKNVWGNTIVNYTGEDIRRIDMVFGIGYGDDIPQAMKVLEEVAKEHPQTLDEPGVAIEVLELGDSSVNLGCRPWVKSDDYLQVMWELTRQIKMRFDEEGISIPFPQRDVHLIQESGS